MKTTTTTMTKQKSYLKKIVRKTCFAIGLAYNVHVHTTSVRNVSQTHSQTDQPICMMMMMISWWSSYRIASYYINVHMYCIRRCDVWPNEMLLFKYHVALFILNRIATCNQRPTEIWCNFCLELDFFSFKLCSSEFLVITSILIWLNKASFFFS